MSKPLRIGVLGGGHLGRIHIHQLKELGEWELVGFHDPHPEKRAALSQEFGVRAFEEATPLLEQVDVVDIVTPTLTHATLATDALKRGLHVFIEKPVTQTIAEAEELLATADRGDDVCRSAMWSGSIPLSKRPCHTSRTRCSSNRIGWLSSTRAGRM